MRAALRLARVAGNGALRPYPCPDCREWHLTSKPLRPKKGTP